MSEGDKASGKIIRTSSGKGTRLTAGGSGAAPQAGEAAANASETPAKPDTDGTGTPNSGASGATGQTSGAKPASGAASGTNPAPASGGANGGAGGSSTSGGGAKPEAKSEAKPQSGSGPATETAKPGGTSAAKPRGAAPDATATQPAVGNKPAGKPAGQTGQPRKSSSGVRLGGGSAKPATGSAPTSAATTVNKVTPDAPTTALGSQDQAARVGTPTGAAVPAAASRSTASQPSRASDGLFSDEPAAKPASTSKKKGKKAKKGPRTVKLTVSTVDPWTVMKMTFLLSLAIAIVFIVAVLVLWFVLSATGTLDSLQATLSEIAGTESADSILQLLALGRIMSFTVIIAVINIVLYTALATLFAFVYNLAASMVGGLHLTLTDD